MNTILETRRLRLRALEATDLDSVAALLADAEVMRYWPRPQTRDEAAACAGVAHGVRRLRASGLRADAG